jgi:hypothetical protein
LLMFFGLVGSVIAVCGVLVLWRLRRWSSARAEAEQRAVLAFEEMQRVTKSLRSEAETAADGLTPGERLQQRYAGPKEKTAI